MTDVSMRTQRSAHPAWRRATPTEAAGLLRRFSMGVAEHPAECSDHAVEAHAGHRGLVLQQDAVIVELGIVDDLRHSVQEFRQEFVSDGGGVKRGWPVRRSLTADGQKR